MNRRVSRAYFLIPVAYVGVIFLLFFLQYYGDELFRASISDLTINGKLARSDESQNEIASAEVSYRGLSFSFDETSSLLIEHADGTTEVLPIRTYETREDGFDLLFAKDARLSFSLSTEEPGQEELYVQPILPADLLPVERVSFPYQVTGAVPGETEAVQASLTVEYEAQTFYLTVPPRSEIRLETRQIIVPGDLERQTIRYTQLVGDPQDVVSIWFADDSLGVSQPALQSTIGGYIDSAYAGWRQRFNSGAGTWEMKSGTAAFRESIAVAYLAEAWVRGDYTRAFNEMRRATDLHQGLIGLESAVYLGDLREVRAEYIEDDAERTIRLIEAVRRRDATVFRDPNLVSFAANHGSQALLDEIIDFAAIVDFRDADLLSAIGMLANYVEAGSISESLQKSLGRFRAIATERVLPALIKADDGFFVESGQGQVDLRYSLQAGLLLDTIESDDTRLQTVGRNLVTSVLSQADDAGFLPAVLLISGGSVQQTQGRIGPEDVYPLITTSEAYPRTVSLYNQLGQGSWIRTARPVTAISITPRAFEFQIDNLPNRTHYMIFQGIPDFVSMQLFGLTWRNAPDFEIYSKGRHYNETTRTLMVKYYDDDPVGQIILRY